MSAILGLWDGHDASVALMADGELVFALSEERPSRRKRHSGFPARALQACLAWADAQGLPIDEVALAGRYGRAPLRLLEPVYARTRPHRDPLSLAGAVLRGWENQVPSLAGAREVEARLGEAPVRWRLAARIGRNVPIRRVDHHDAHAFSALLGGGPGPAVVVTWDAYGEGRAATMRTSGAPGRAAASLGVDAALAALYGAVTVLLGFSEGDEGKLTGLAASGRPDPAAGRFHALFDDVDGAPRLRRPLAAAPLRAMLRDLPREDVAAGLQSCVEDLAVRWIARAMSQVPGARALHVAGGLFANVCLNQRLAAMPGVDRLFVFPHMGDGGLSAGAAHAAWVARSGSQAAPLRHVFLGVDWAAGDCDAAVRAAGLRAWRSDAPSTAMARHLAGGRTVCVFDGRDEFGPRALGHRSILFPASDPARPDAVNRALHRDGFMPFAPAVLDDEIPRAFPGAPGSADLRFMTVCADAGDAFRRACPGGVHVDGTARPQAVDATVSPRLHATLRTLRDLAGVPGVVNTSFNLHGEPMVHSPQDAVRTFVAARLDVLFLGDLEVRGPHAVD